MFQDNEVKIIISAIDEASKKMKEVEAVARDTKKRLDKNTVLKLRADIAALDLGLKEAKKKLAKAKDRNTKLSLTLDTQRLQRELTEAKRKLNNYLNTGEQWISRLQDKFNALWGKMIDSLKIWAINLATKWVEMLLSAVVSTVQKAKDLAISFESAFAWVKKTIDASAGEFQGLKKELKDLTTQIPLSFEEIAKIAELWGQLGIAKKDLTEFTRVIANLWTSTNLSTEQAATALARIANVFQLSSKDYEKLGNTIVQLGNNFATTETEIVDFSSYLMASAKTAGFTADEVFAIGATLSSVGIKAEAGGSAFSTAISKINTAVALGDKTVADFAKVAGLSAEEFAHQWREKPAEAFTRFVEGLGNEGNLAIPIIQELLGKNIRLQNGMLATANAGNILRDALAMAHEEYANGSALQTEADKRYETSQSKIQMLDNQLNNMSETLWKNLIPSMVWWKEILVDVHWWINNLFGATDVFSEYLGRLTDKISENEAEMKKLSEAYREGKLSKEEYLEKMQNLGTEKAKLKQAYKEEEQALSQSDQAMEKIEERLEELQEKQAQYTTELAEAREKQEALEHSRLGGEWVLSKYSIVIDQLTNKINKNAEEEKKLIEQKAQLEKANAEREVSNYSLKDTFDMVKDAMKKVNDFRINESATRAEFEKTKKAALDSIDAFEKRLSMIGLHSGNVVSSYINTQMAKFVNKSKGLLEKFQRKGDQGKSSWSEIFPSPTKKSSWRWWGWSAKSKTENLKKELEKQKQLEIQAVKDSELTEEAKMLKIYEIKEKYDKKAKELEGKTDEELLKQAEDYMKNLKEQREQTYKDHKKKADEATKDIKKYTENLDKIKTKFGEIKEKASETLRNIKQDLSTLDEEHIKNLGARYYEVNKKLQEWGLEYEERIKLEKELLYLEERTTKEQQEQAKLEAEKSESVKLVEKYEKQRAQLVEKQNIIASFTSAGELGEQKLKIDGEKTTYRDEEKQQYIEITDFKNQEYARDLINQQIKLDTEYKAEEKKLNDSKDLALKHSQEIIKIWEKETQNYKSELLKRVDITRDYVNQVKAMMAEINQAKSNAQGSVVNNNHQTTNSNNKTTNYHITNIWSRSSAFPGVGLK